MCLCWGIAAPALLRGVVLSLLCPIRVWDRSPGRYGVGNAGELVTVEGQAGYRAEGALAGVRVVPQPPVLGGEAADPDRQLVANADGFLSAGRLPCPVDHLPDPGDHLGIRLAP